MKEVIRWVEDYEEIDKDRLLIRCKDCKHRPTKPAQYENGFDLDFPDEKCPCKCEDGYYSWYPADNWYCASAERKEK